MNPDEELELEAELNSMKEELMAIQAEHGERSGTQSQPQCSTPRYNIDDFLDRPNKDAAELVEELYGIIYDSLAAVNWQREQFFPEELVIFDAWEFDTATHSGFANLLYLSNGGLLFVYGHQAFKKLDGPFFQWIDDAKKALESLGHDFTLPLKHENACAIEGEPDWPSLEAATKPMDDAFWNAKDNPSSGTPDIPTAILQFVEKNREKFQARRP